MKKVDHDPDHQDDQDRHHQNDPDHAQNQDHDQRSDLVPDHDQVCYLFSLSSPNLLFRTQRLTR